VHLRDTGRTLEKMQVKIGQGEVEYGRILAQLERQRYDRLLTVELIDVPELPFCMETEVRKLKFLLESLL
jgi:sugar phosphate isomerase/epimerase